MNLRVLYLTRTWAFSVHKHKLKLLGRWPATTSMNKGKSITSGINSNVSGPPAAVIGPIGQCEAVTGLSTTFVQQSHENTDVPPRHANTTLVRKPDLAFPGFVGERGDGHSGGGGGGGATVGGHGGAPGDQHPVSQFVSNVSSPVTVVTDLVTQHVSQHDPIASIDCELSPPGLGGGEGSAVVEGGGAAVTCALFVPRYPPASPTWRGGAGKV